MKMPNIDINDTPHAMLKDKTLQATLISLFKYYGDDFLTRLQEDYDRFKADYDDYCEGYTAGYAGISVSPKDHPEFAFTLNCEDNDIEDLIEDGLMYEPDRWNPYPEVQPPQNDKPYQVLQVCEHIVSGELSYFGYIAEHQDLKWVDSSYREVSQDRNNYAKTKIYFKEWKM